MWFNIGVTRRDLLGAYAAVLLWIIG